MRGTRAGGVLFTVTGLSVCDPHCAFTPVLDVSFKLCVCMCLCADFEARHDHSSLVANWQLDRAGLSIELFLKCMHQSNYPKSRNPVIPYEFFMRLRPHRKPGLAKLYGSNATFDSPPSFGGSRRSETWSVHLCVDVRSIEWTVLPFRVSEMIL